MTGRSLPKRDVAKVKPLSSRSALYITVQTAAATMKIPETNIMSKSPCRSMMTSGSTSGGR